MENMDKKECGGMCGEGGHGGCCGGMGHMHGCHGRHHLMKVILKLIIIAIIFCFGFQLGVMTGFIKAQSGYGLRDGIGGWGMMRGNVFYGQNVPSATIPAPTK